MTDPSLPSTEAVGEVRRRRDDRELLIELPAGADVMEPLRGLGWLPPLAAERLFEQRDTAIAEAQVLRERVRVAGSESRQLIAKAEAERDQAIADLKAFGGEVARLYGVEREAERMRKVVEAARVITESGDMPTTLMWVALAEAVDTYTTKEATDG